MAQYTRFEIYIPVVYHTRESDPGGQEFRRVHAIDPILLSRFVQETTETYGGFIQANPLLPVLYKGWWYQDSQKKLYVDHLTYLFGLVRIDQTDDAAAFF